MIVLLTEEASMGVTLEALIRMRHPERTEGVDWFVLNFQGKTDLARNIPKKMRTWNFGEPVFIILRDADGGDCVLIKRELADLATPLGKPFKVRIVCQELESWFIGDNQAVTAAFPKCRFSNETAKYRNPDRLTNASQELATLTGDATKVTRAGLIAPHLDSGRNRSGSFNLLVATLQEFLG